MPMTLEQIAFEALGLPTRSRAELAEKLIASLDETDEANAADVDTLWVKEAARRYEEIREGKATCYSLEEFLDKAREEAKK